MIPLPANARLVPDAEAMARLGAEHVLAAATRAGAERVAVCLSGGSTPRRLYEILAGPDFAPRLPWARLHIFLGDERMVPWEDPSSNAHMVRAAFGGDAGPVPAENLHLVPTRAGAQAGADAYAADLRAFHGSDRLDPERPLFDLMLLGLGSDGHTASLFPGKPALDATAWVAPVPEAGLEPFVPRVSLTLPALASSRAVLFLVSGAGKRDPLARLAAGADLPAGRVRSLGPVTWLVDRAAADA